ncbi:Aste57867_10850 [Aphanomyces stellatus]|uniref:Aste57867_10850 protein n=1 Tax=Aphanomyces stellatus TaxID=120398 RepID=A0A485KSK6_9STRA|nr:hypothetical protein As57867_010810 [Aphanomyces stellatus]VFT87718.1 Aste57867_10850 [Aphanomyces stellatus]
MFAKQYNNTAATFVFGWNNFLCPSSWLQQTITMRPNLLLHPTQRSLLDAIDTSIVTVLSQARSLGSVVVVYDDSMSQLEQLCTYYFPQCTRLFCAASDIAFVPHTPHGLNAIHQTKAMVFGASSLRQNCICVAPDAVRRGKFVSTPTAWPSMAQVLHHLSVLGQGLLSHVAQYHAALDICL